MSIDHGFLTTRLWQRTLAPQCGDPIQAGTRETLRSVFITFRERAHILTGEIARDLPEFTVHDVTHTDALWEMADIIAGEHLSLTAAEAFVLGGAFLIHDAGMGLAAYPDGRKGLRRDPSWNDILTANCKKRFGRLPTRAELDTPSNDIEFDVLVELLRLRHARQAGKLAKISWKSPDGQQIYHLIEHPELRKSYGDIIGEIAYSHWWDLEEVREKFGDRPPLGPAAITGFPNAWTVDRVKLACLLRTADAIHLDARRAPGYLRALRKPSGYADLHWAFQEHINRPSLDGDRLVFTSGHAFSIDESAAWWTGYELLQNADRELRQTDALLQDLKRTYRFAARSVACVESPVRLALNIPTKDWTPVDVRIGVSDVAKLVRNLGGEQLYGRDRTVPLRELIQNASDAVRARRLLQKKAERWGTIVVRIGQDDDGHWIEVEDNGVGMSTAVLSGPFLDFGRSFWGTAMMRQELPGLEATGFDSTGRFGIGFFSVFMWGQRVKVTTLQFRDAPRDTQVLEFRDGLGVRPRLRKAQEAEYLIDGGGTRVRVWLSLPAESLFSTFWQHLEKKWRFVNSDSFNNIVISAFPGLIECIARSFTTLVMNICLDGFRAWQRGDATTIDCLDHNIQYFVERNTGVISTEPFSPNLIPWLKEIGSPINGTLNELCDKYGLRRDIIVIPFTIGFRDIVDDKGEFGEIYLYQSSRMEGERDTFANGIAWMIGVSLDIVTAIISGTLFIVLLFTALFWPGATGILIGVIAVAFGGGSIAFIIQDKRTRIRGWNIPVWLRGILVPEQRYVGQIRMCVMEMKTNLKPVLTAQIRIDTVIQVLKQAINVRLSDIS